VRRPTRIVPRPVDLDHHDAAVDGDLRPRFRPKARRRSASGMTLPRKLMTLPTKAPAPGHAVSGSRSVDLADQDRAEGEQSRRAGRRSAPRPRCRSRPTGRRLRAAVIRRREAAPPAAGPARRDGRRRGSERRRRRPGWSLPRRSAGRRCSADIDLMTVWWSPMIWSTTRPTRSAPVETTTTFWCGSGWVPVSNISRRRRNGTRRVAQRDEAAAARAQVLLEAKARCIPRRRRAGSRSGPGRRGRAGRR
jgi:hypothetical protein